MPERVPLHVILSGLIRRLASLIKTCCRGLAVALVWLVVLPSFTLWTWRFYFWSGENIGFRVQAKPATESDTSSFWTTTTK
ncbi:uncharacterized protein B0P05DRAFT_555191 [Gilbertella persicaria]|nr:uncharacterized protein B0P05DRAFT_555191 [Gilbertella persicaria]KAI8063658.1 hypothetical protein B0P05DRAFT_555191 [Gilbertella persicaria]